MIIKSSRNVLNNLRILSLKNLFNLSLTESLETCKHQRYEERNLPTGIFHLYHTEGV